MNDLTSSLDFTVEYSIENGKCVACQSLTDDCACYHDLYLIILLYHFLSPLRIAGVQKPHEKAAEILCSRRMQLYSRFRFHCIRCDWIICGRVLQRSLIHRPWNYTDDGGRCYVSISHEDH